jgi:hypothetical protein
VNLNLNTVLALGVGFFGVLFVMIGVVFRKVDGYYKWVQKRNRK